MQDYVLSLKYHKLHHCSFFSIFISLSLGVLFFLSLSITRTHIDAQIQTQGTAMIVQRDYYVEVVVEVFVIVHFVNSCLKFHCLEHERLSDLPVSLKYNLSLSLSLPGN